MAPSSNPPTAPKPLQDSDRQLRTLMNHLPGMAYRTEFVGGRWNPVFVSQGIQNLLGYDPDDFMANKDRLYPEIFHPRDRIRTVAQMQAAIEHRRPFELTYRITTAGGQSKWVWEQGEAVYGPHGKPLAIEGFITDISRQKRSELELHDENRRLKSAIGDRYRFQGIVGKSTAMQKVYRTIIKAAASNANVVVYGESGTGKELVAQAIHKLSDRGARAFVTVNCGALPATLVESEFFGYLKGAFTGANADRRGYLAAAHGGTLFLDELGDIDLELQVKLLRAIEYKRFTPVGANAAQASDVRIIAATNRNMTALVSQGSMREDFYYRIHVLPVHLPPLRERQEDIPLLIDHFLEKLETGESKVHMTAALLAAMRTYDWPGNVRQLENILQRFISLGDDALLDELRPGAGMDTKTLADMDALETGSLRRAVEAFEKQLIVRVLEQTRWHRGKAASILAVTSRTLYRKMRSYGIG